MTNYFWGSRQFEAKLYERVLLNCINPLCNLHAWSYSISCNTFSCAYQTTHSIFRSAQAINFAQTIVVSEKAHFTNKSMLTIHIVLIIILHLSISASVPGVWHTENSGRTTQSWCYAQCWRAYSRCSWALYGHRISLHNHSRFLQSWRWLIIQYMNNSHTSNTLLVFLF